MEMFAKKPLLISVIGSLVLSATIIIIMFFLPWEPAADCDLTQDCIQEANLIFYGFPYPYKVIGLASQFFLQYLLIDFFIYASLFFILTFIICKIIIFNAKH